MNRFFYFLSLLLTMCIAFSACGDGNEPEDPDLPDNNPRREDYTYGYYVGEFNDKGERHGHGTFYWNSGNKYEGHWENGKRNGQGTFTWASGAKYVGNWKEDERSGQGEMTYDSGSVYKGSWENDKCNGEGVLTWASGAKYVGNWKDDERSGQGEMTYTGGNVYKGNWEKSERSGQGTFTYKDETTFTCQWKNDRPDEERCFLLWFMKSWYLWNNELDKVDVTQYSSAEDLLARVKKQEDALSAVSAIGTTAGNLFLEGKETGYGFGVRWDPDDELRVAWVHEDSPANLYGVKRGWKVLKINDTNVQSLSSVNISAEKENESMRFAFEDEKGISKTTSLTSKTFKIQSVLYKNTYQLPNKKVGYIVLKSFAQQNAEEIKQNTNALVNSGIQELVLDLRYCSGGNYILLNEFANAIFPNSANNKTFMTRKYNPDQSANDTTYLIQKTGSLDLDRIFVLTTSSTGNLGRYLMLNMKPYIKMIQTGSKTDGTSMYGTSYWDFDSRKRHSIITSAFYNAGDELLSDGFVPDYPTYDGVEKNWGDENEEMLKNVLYFITNGYFPLSTRSAGKMKKQQEANRKIQDVYSPAESIQIITNQQTR
jgi:hypothetical protein